MIDTLDYIVLFLFIILGIIITIYISYFSYDSIKKLKLQIKENEFDKESFILNKEDNKKRKNITYILSSLFLLISITFFSFSLSLKISNNLFSYNNHYIVSINSNSMNENNVNNSYLFTENLEKEKLYIYDLVYFNKVDINTEINKYDIVLYKYENIYITHRIIDIYNENGETYFVLRGDSLINNDPEPIKKENIFGIYSHTLSFPSFINYIAHSPSLYVIFSFIILNIIIYESSSIYKNKLVKYID